MQVFLFFKGRITQMSRKECVCVGAGGRNPTAGHRPLSEVSVYVSLPQI